MIHKIDRAALAATVRDLQGISSEDKAALLELINDHKKYGLVWENKPENVEERLREEIPVLREVKERAIVSDEPNAPNHIIIEGDNFQALTTLSYTHEGKIDVIYIDPPYNTGNKDFIYNDSFVDAEDSYRHSKWLSFMNKRLKSAKHLLSEKGVIFISINDNEQAQLKLLCNEIFGEACFIALFIWKSRQNKDNRNITGVSIDHEYVLCYSKFPGIRALKGAERKTEQYSNPDNDPRGPWASGNMAGILDAIQRPNCHYDLINPRTGINYGKPKMGWRYDKNTMNRLIEENRIIWPESPSGRPRKKTFLSEISDVQPGFSSVIGDNIFTRDGTKQLDDIFVKRPFDYPKPTELIKEMVAQSTRSNSTILDFFAGSGTTLHATMQLNAEDGGHRQCILVTNNENNICEEVTYERNKRVINGYTTPKGEMIEGLHNNNLRYYKTDFLSRDRAMSNMRRLVNASTDLLCIKEDLYSEQNKFGRWKIPSQIARYYSDGQKHMLIVYDERLVEQLSKMINEIDFGKERLKIYIFSPSRYAFDDEFYEVQDKVQLIALPAAIYDAYSKVLPKRKPQLLDTEDEKEAEIEINLDNLFDLPEDPEEL